MQNVESKRDEVFARLFTPDGSAKADLDRSPPLTSSDVAALFRMTERAIRMQAAKGILPHMRTLGGGRLLYPPQEIAALYLRHYSTAHPSPAVGRSRQA